MLHKRSVVVLVGPMGVGKTTIGRKLAKSLGVPFRDTDALIVQQHGEIPKLFESLGERGFREIEESVVAEAIKQAGVVATGGGAVLSETTRAALKSSTVFYLSTDGRHMASRLAHGNRPLLKNGIEDWRRIYDERKPIYESCADFIINTSNQSLASAIEEIKARLAD